MKKKRKKDIASILADDKLIDAALSRAVRRALLMHKRAGNPIAVWKNGKVVLLQPDEIDV